MHRSRREVIAWLAGAPVLTSSAIFSVASAQPIGSLGDAMREIVRQSNAMLSDEILLDIPVFAEAGQNVPVAITVKLPDIESIALFVEKNVQSLAATFRIRPPVEPMFRTQLILERSTNVFALARSRGTGKHYYQMVDVIVESQDGCL